MKVYHVTAEFEVDYYVAAEDEMSAIAEAEDCFREAVDNEGGLWDPYISTPREVTDLATLPEGERRSLPYGDNPDDLTIEQILTPEPTEPEPVKDTWTAEMFPESKAGGGESEGA